MAKKIALPTELIIGDATAVKLRTNPVFRQVFRGRALVISGKGKTAAIARQYCADLFEPSADVRYHQVQGNSLGDFHGLEALLMREQADVLVGIGGGLVIDSSKVVGTRTQTPVVLVPTAISSDAVCSPVARVQLEGVVSIGVKMPKIVAMDLNLLRMCPDRLVRAGIGDLISNVTALADWKLAHESEGEEYDTFAALIARNAAESLIALCQDFVRDRDRVLRVVAEALILSGMAMSIAGSSRPCSGSEHLISHALDHLYGGKALHGEQVAVATLVSMHLHERNGVAYCDPSFLGASLRGMFSAFGLPLSPRAIGYSDIEFLNAIIAAPSMRRRYTILDRADLAEGSVHKLMKEVFGG